MPASRIWVGAYTDDLSGVAEGISLVTVADDGSLEDGGLAVATDSPSYLTRSGDTIYAVNEGAGALSAFTIARDELHPHGRQDAAGKSPCAAAVLGDCDVLAVACYGDGTIDVHPIASDGALQQTCQSLRGGGGGPRSEQEGPHAHSVLALDSSTVLTADLGTDEIHVHVFDGRLLTRTGRVKLESGTGPRDLVRHPSGFVLALGELSCELIVLDPGADPAFAVVGHIALPGAEPGDHAAAVALSDDGRFAYVGLRGSDLISVVGVTADGAHLVGVGAVACGGGWPRHLVVDGGLLRVANQLSGNIATFTLGSDGIPIAHSSLTTASPTYLLLD